MSNQNANNSNNDPFASKRYEEFSNEYKSIGAKDMSQQVKKPLNISNTQENKTKSNNPNWIKRKTIKIKKAASDFWIMGKQGFTIGCLAGACLGFFAGGYESIRMRSLWPLPLAMIGSGLTFGCIFAISTVVRAEENNNINENVLKYEIVYFDKNSKCFIRKEASKLNLKI